MRFRHATLTVALTALPLVATATPAHALTCPLIADATGDATTLGRFGPLQEPYPPLVVGLPTSRNADIVRADVASGATTVVVQMQVASLDPDLFTLLGPEWFVAWDIGTNSYAVSTRQSGFGQPGYITAFRLNDTSAGSVTFTVDDANDTVTWTIDRSLLPDLATPGATFSYIHAGTKVFSGSTDFAPDWPVEPPDYVDQAPACIAAS